MSGGLPFTTIYPDDPNAPSAAGDGGAGGANINEEWPGLPPGASPESRDITLTAATLGTNVWTPAADERLVVVAVYISSDAAGRVAVVDDQDVAGQRIVVQYVGANGGSSPNLVPAPYATQVPGAPIKVASTVVGNVYVRVTGYVK